MKYKITFSGKEIDLDQNANDVIRDMQNSLNTFYPTPNDFVKISGYRETGPKSMEFEIERTYVDNGGIALGADFISDKDASILTGLDESAFQPFVPGKAIIMPLIPWYDHMVYTPKSQFVNLWKNMIKTMAKQEVKDINVIVGINSIKVSMEF